MSRIMNQSQTAMDALTAPGQCGSNANISLGGPSGGHVQGRCGYSPRLPLMVISPFAKRNYVDQTVTDRARLRGYRRQLAR